MSDLDIRIDGRAGRITLTRPAALNALTYEMVRRIDAALKDWRSDGEVALVVIDAEGEKAFCAGGDIAEMYTTGRAGDFDYGRRFWADEYRMNARIAAYPKPVVSFLQGFTMGGGVGLGCHGSHRIVAQSSRIAMPECGIGLVPDVGGSWLLARAPLNFGAFMGLTGYRMGPEDALYAGFADYFVPQAAWPDLVAHLCSDGDPGAIETQATDPEPGNLVIWPETSRWFGGATLSDILADLDRSDAANAADHSKAMRRNSPLAMACALRLIRDAQSRTLEEALAAEYRFVYRCMEHGDFLEGIRAQVIDKDRRPNWRHGPGDVTRAETDAMLAPLPGAEMSFDAEEVQ